MMNWDSYWWIYCIGVLICPILLFEIGFWGGRKHGKVSDEHRSQAGTTLTAHLTLFGLILAFTFNIASNRFADRKKTVLKEANAIGTAFLRSDFLPANQYPKARELFRDYVVERLKVTQPENANNPMKIKESIQICERIQQDIWKIASSNANHNPSSEPLSLLIQALNDMIDIHEERLTYALYFHLPRSIEWILAIIGVFAVTLLGYNNGLTGQRNILLFLPLIFSFCAVILMIVDLDQTTSHFFSVNQNPMMDVLRMIESSH